MTLERLSAKKVYYYFVCMITLFVLMLGTIDIVSSVISYAVFKPPDIAMESPTTPKGMPDTQGSEPFIDDYYRSKMLFDRMGDSMARLLVSGLIFAYFSFRLKEMELAEKI